MENTKNHFLAPLAIFVIVAIIGIGVYIYSRDESRKRMIQNLPGNEIATSTENNTATETAGENPNLTLNEPLVQNSCEDEIKRDIENLEIERVKVRYIEGQAFSSIQSAKDFMIGKGFTNAGGHGTKDLGEASSFSIFIGVIGLKSSYLVEDEDGRRGFKNIEITQPIVCVDNAIASNSKNFLTVVLKDEDEIRAAIFLKDK